jgi:hypothetical protein
LAAGTAELAKTNATVDANSMAPRSSNDVPDAECGAGVSREDFGSARARYRCHRAIGAARD